MFDNTGSMMGEVDNPSDEPDTNPMGQAMGQAMAGEMASALSDHVDRMQAIMDRYGVADTTGNPAEEAAETEPG